MTSRKHSPQLPSVARASSARAGERGYALVALLAVMAVLALAMTAAAPSLRQQSLRDLEREAIARGEEVAEAIAVYAQAQQRLGRPPLPTSMDDLLKGVEPQQGSFKKMQILRRAAARDPLSSDGEWKLVRVTDRAFTDFQLGVVKYNGGQLPQPVLYRSFAPLVPQPAVTGIVDLKQDDEPPGGEDTESNTSGPFIGVVSRSRRKSVLVYYGIERHDRWVFTPAYR